MKQHQDDQMLTVSKPYCSHLLTKTLQNELKKCHGNIIKSNENLFFLNKSQQFVLKNHYFLYQHFLICKNKYYEFENCQITLENQIIILEKEGKQFLIKGMADSLKIWYDHLKRFAIQRNFKQYYKKCELLGKGSQAKVYKIIQIETNRIFATKQYDKKKLNQKSLSHLLKEISILRKLENDGVTRLHDVFENKKRIYLILDLFEGGELLDQIRAPNYKYNEQFVMDFALNFLEIINYVHSQGIMHRDLKPENLILRDKNDYTDFVIADFGLAEYYNSGIQQLEKCGTIGYIAPEVLQNQQYDNKVDIYSIGVIIYILFTGEFPFDGNNTEEVYLQNKKGKINKDSLQQLKITSKAKDFVFSLLNDQPNNRPTARQALDHEWFKLPSYLTNHIIIYSLYNIPDLNQKEKYLSIDCTSPLWNQIRNLKSTLNEINDDAQNVQIFFKKQSNEFDEIQDEEFNLEDLNFETSVFTVTPSQCCNYCFSNSKIRILNEMRDTKQI